MAEREQAGGVRPRRTSNYEKLKVVAVGFVAIWMLASVWQHSIASLKMLRGPHPRSMTHHIGFVSTTVEYDTAAARVNTGSGQTGVPTAGTVTTGMAGTTGTTGTTATTGSGGTGVTPGDIGTKKQGLGGDDGDRSGLGLDITMACDDEGHCVCLLNHVVPIPMVVCWIVGIFIICWLIAVIVDALLSWVCENKWVQEPVSWTECSERDCAWYDAWCWANKLFCYLVEGLKWVLKQICAWKTVIVWGTALVCAIVGIIILVSML